MKLSTNAFYEFYKINAEKSDKTELQNLNKSPVCLFPTRKQCEKVNEDMLDLLKTEKHVIRSKNAPILFFLHFLLRYSF